MSNADTIHTNSLLNNRKCIGSVNPGCFYVYIYGFVAFFYFITLLLISNLPTCCQSLSAFIDWYENIAVGTLPI